MKLSIRQSSVVVHGSRSSCLSLFNYVTLHVPLFAHTVLSSRALSFDVDPQIVISGLGHTCRDPHVVEFQAQFISCDLCGLPRRIWCGICTLGTTPRSSASRQSSSRACLRRQVDPRNILTAPGVVPRHTHSQSPSQVTSRRLPPPNAIANSLAAPITPAHAPITKLTCTKHQLQPQPNSSL